VTCVIHVSRLTFEERFQNCLFDIKRFHTIGRLFFSRVYKKRECGTSDRATPTQDTKVTIKQFFGALYFLELEARFGREVKRSGRERKPAYFVTLLTL